MRCKVVNGGVIGMKLDCMTLFKPFAAFPVQTFQLPLIPPAMLPNFIHTKMFRHGTDFRFCALLGFVETVVPGVQTLDFVVDIGRCLNPIDLHVTHSLETAIFLGSGVSWIVLKKLSHNGIIDALCASFGIVSAPAMQITDTGTNLAHHRAFFHDRAIIISLFGTDAAAFHFGNRRSEMDGRFQCDSLPFIGAVVNLQVEVVTRKILVAQFRPGGAPKLCFLTAVPVGCCNGFTCIQARLGIIDAVAVLVPTIYLSLFVVSRTVLFEWSHGQ